MYANVEVIALLNSLLILEFEVNRYVGIDKI